MLAYTGLETISNLAEETREPGRAPPRSLFSAIGLVVILTVLIALVGLSALPVENGETALGDEWLRAPIPASYRVRRPAPGCRRRPAPLAIGLTGALVLLAAATTSMSGCTRLAYALAQHGQLPRALAASTAARSSRRPRSSPPPWSPRLVMLTGLVGDDVTFLASLYSFGVLLTFTAAQIAVIKLRAAEPDLRAAVPRAVLRHDPGVACRCRRSSARR